MSKVFCILLLCPIMGFGQISFTKDYLTGAHVHDVSPPTELSNGNFICSAIHGKDGVWFNIIYLFSECGDLVTKLHLSTPAEYMFVNQFFDLDPGRILASGFVSDTAWHSIYLILDAFTLEVLHQVRYFESSLHTIAHTEMRDGLLYQYGYAGSRIVSTRLNLGLNRNLHINRVYDAEEYPDLRYDESVFVSGQYLLKNESYRDTSYDSYNVIRSLDYKLRERYVISGYGSWVYTDFGHIVPLGGDTLLVATQVRSRFDNAFQYYIRQYFRDSMIYEKPVHQLDDFVRSWQCYYQNGIVQCLKNDRTLFEFNTQGTLLSQITMDSVLKEGDLYRAIRTKDNGFFAISNDYLLVDGVWKETLRLVKTTADFQIPDIPHPNCIVATQMPVSVPDILVYPNPSSGSFKIESKSIIEEYVVFDAAGVIVETGRPTVELIEFTGKVSSGIYYIMIRTNGEWYTHKLFIAN